MLILKLTGKAKQVFPLLALFAKLEGNKALQEPKELWLSWYLGRPIEPLETVDFSKN